MSKEIDFSKLTKAQADMQAARFTAYEKFLKSKKLEHELNAIDSSNYGRRTVLLAGITEYGATAAVELINRYRRMDPGCPIRIEINSPGGSVFPGLALYDILREASSEGHFITTVAYGYAASMGGILLQAGDERQMAPNAFMMIHEVSSGAMGKWSEMVDEVEFVGRLQKLALEMLAKRSKLTVRQIKNKSARQDWWLDATEALECGFIDSIADPDVDTIRAEIE